MKDQRPQRKAGRPTYITPAFTERICTRVEGGLRLSSAVAAEGIAPRTLIHWQVLIMLMLFQNFFPLSHFASPSVRFQNLGLQKIHGLIHLI